MSVGRPGPVLTAAMAGTCTSLWWKVAAWCTPVSVVHPAAPAMMDRWPAQMQPVPQVCAQLTCPPLVGCCTCRPDVLNNC